MTGPTNMLAFKDQMSAALPNAASPKPGQPGIPSVIDCSSTSVTLTWGEPRCVENKIKYYVLQYRIKGGDRWVTVETQDDTNVFIVSGLKSRNFYEFRVRVIFENEEEGPFSEINRNIQTKPSFSESILHESSKNEKYDPPVYELRLKEDESSVNAEAKTRRLIFGTSRSCYDREKTIMLLGATGSGKSTLINGIVNYFFGVEWEDDWRFSIIALTDEETTTSNDQSKSQTKWITCYTIHSKESKHSYTLNVIDTPGFGDTGGVERDKFLVDQITVFFKTPPPRGIRELDAVCFVTQAPLLRLTSFQTYIIDSVLSIFGKDMATNIFVLITFADGNEPPVLKALEAANVPYTSKFLFNSSALFVKKKSKPVLKFGEMFWKMGAESFKYFFTELEKTETRSLQLTSEVLDARKRLKITIQGLKPQIMQCLNTIDGIREEKRVLDKHMADLLANKDFEYEVVENVSIRIPISAGEYVTNCRTCKMTCHYPCAYESTLMKYRCKAISIFGFCNVCPKECNFLKHSNDTHLYESIPIKVKKTSHELKKKYDIASKKTKKHSGYLEMAEKKLNMEVKNVSKMIQRAGDCVSELQEKALKNDPSIHENYIEQLINSQKEEANCGWEKRVELLMEFKNQAAMRSNQIPPQTNEAL